MPGKEVGRKCASCGHVRTVGERRPYYRCPKCREFYPREGAAKPETGSCEEVDGKLVVPIHSTAENALVGITAASGGLLCLFGLTNTSIEQTLLLLGYSVGLVAAIVVPYFMLRRQTLVIDIAERTFGFEHLFERGVHSSRLGRIVDTKIDKRYAWGQGYSGWQYVLQLHCGGGTLNVLRRNESHHLTGHEARIRARLGLD